MFSLSARTADNHHTMKEITMNKTIAAITAGIALAAAPVAAYADTTTASKVETWVWATPDGTLIGQCPAGTYARWSTVPDGATYWYGWGNWRSTGLSLDAVLDRAKAEGMTATNFGYEWNAGAETTVNTDNQPTPGKMNEGDCIAVGTTIPEGDYHGGDSLPVKIVKHHDGTPAVTETRTTVVKGRPARPAVTVNRTRKIPGKPAVTTITNAHDYRLAQIDTYHYRYTGTKHNRPFTATERKRLDAARAADKRAGVLKYRQGSASVWLWGSTTATIKTVELCNMPRTAANTDVWVLGKGATASAPWGKGGKIAQTTVAKAGAKCAPIVKVIKPAVPARTETYTVTIADAVPATPDTTREETVVVTPAVPAWDEYKTVTRGEVAQYSAEGWEEVK